MERNQEAGSARGGGIRAFLSGPERKRVAALLFWLGAALLLYAVRRALPPFLAALVLVYLLHPVVEWWEKRGVGRTAAILLTYAGLGLVATGFGLLLLPRLLAELVAASAQLPLFLEGLSRRLINWEARFLPWLPGTLQAAWDDAVLTVQGTLAAWVRGTVRGFLEVTPQLASLSLAPFLAYFFLRDLERITLWLHRWLPFHLGKEGEQALAEMDLAVGGFFRGQVLVASLVGGLVAGAMFVLGMPFPLLLGAVAGLTDLVPYFGPLLGGIPAVLLALGRGPALVAKVVVALVLIQQAENGFLAPRIVGRRTGLHPLVVAGALLAGGWSYGLAGMLLAVPVAGALRPLVELGYRRWVGERR